MTPIGSTFALIPIGFILLAGDQVRLAPIYDVASALPYGVHERKLRFAMKLGGRYDVFLHHNPWPRAATELGLDVEELSSRVRDLAVRAADTFSDAASSPDVAALGRDLALRLVDLVAGRSRRCLGLLSSGGG